MKTHFLADMAFMARISDPLVGASYMTLLNTLSNLGGRWVKTFFLWLVDIITWRTCVVEDLSSLNSTSLDSFNIASKCSNKDQQLICKSIGGTCIIDVDGYYIEVALNAVYGVCWYFWGKSLLEYLQKLPRSDWHVLSKNKENEEKLPLKDQQRDKV